MHKMEVTKRMMVEFYPTVKVKRFPNLAKLCRNVWDGDVTLLEAVYYANCGVTKAKLTHQHLVKMENFLTGKNIDDLVEQLPAGMARYDFNRADHCIVYLIDCND